MPNITMKTVVLAALLLVGLNLMWTQIVLPAITMQTAPALEFGSVVLTVVSNLVVLPAVVWVAAWLQEQYK